MPGNFKEYGGQKGVLRANYDMWVLDYERLNDILKANTDCFLNVRQNPDLIVKIYECLNEFYRILRPMLTLEQRQEKDKEIRELKGAIFKEHNRYQASKGYGTNYALTETVIDNADDFYNALMDLRQIKGMGIKVNYETSEAQKIKRTVRGEE